MLSDSGSQGDSDEGEIADYVNNEMSECEKAREERIKKLEEMKKKIGLAPIAAQPEQVNLYVIYNICNKIYIIYLLHKTTCITTNRTNISLNIFSQKHLDKKTNSYNGKPKCDNRSNIKNSTEKDLDKV